MVMRRPARYPHHLRKEDSYHEGRHAAGDLYFGFPILTASIDLADTPGSDRHGEVKMASELLDLADPMVARQAIVVQLLGYYGADPRWDLPDGREASCWPPPTLADALQEKLEGIDFLSKHLIESEVDWQLVLNMTRIVAADPRFQALVTEIAGALMERQTLLADDLLRIAHPAFDRAVGQV
jgi:hypothetical protein